MFLVSDVSAFPQRAGVSYTAAHAGNHPSPTPPPPVSSSLSTPTNITQLQRNCIKKVHKDSLNFRGIKICFVKIRLKANKSVKSHSWSKKFTLRLYSWCVCYYRRSYTNQWLWQLPTLVPPPPSRVGDVKEENYSTFIFVKI